MSSGIFHITVNIPDGTSSDPNITCGSLIQDLAYVQVPKPDTFISTPPAPIDGSTANSKAASFKYTSNRDSVTFECSLDDDPFSDCTSQPQDYSNLPDGQHTFQVRASDESSADLSPAKRTWIVDATAPSVPVITSPSDNTYNPDGNFTVSGTAEANSTVQLLEGTTSRGTAIVNTSGTWSVVLSGVNEGSHSYKAKATDAAGNASSESEPRTVIVDKSAPTLDTTNPDSVDPDNKQTGVSRDIEPTATFSDEMKEASLSTSAKLYKWNTKKKKWQPVPTKVNVVGNTVTLDPYPTDTSRLLAANKKFKVTFTTEAQNLAGIPLSSNKSWTFTTGGR